MTSRLDNCNTLYVGVSQASLSRLWLVQGARLLTGTRKQEHIPPLLASLHWLPVRFGIDLKILQFTLKCLNGLARLYLSELLGPSAPSGP